WGRAVAWVRRRCSRSIPAERGSGVHQGSGRGEQLAALEPRLQAGEDHRPAAVDLVVRALAHLVVGDREPAGVVADRLDLPRDPRGSLVLHVVAPEEPGALNQPG